jgi:Phage major capsid protein E
MNIYSTLAMQAVLRSLRNTASTWLLDTFFPGGTYSDKEEIAFDIEDDDIELAPFVSPLSAGKVGSDQGYETRFFKPAYVKPLHDIKPDRVLRRLIGEGIGGDLSPQQREQLILADTLRRQQQQILRRKQVMASEVLRTGKCTVTGDDYPTQLVDFRRPAGHTKLLTGLARWGETGVSPYKNLESWLDETSSACGAAVDRVIMTADAWTLFDDDPVTEKRLDRQLGQTATIDRGLNPNLPGRPTLKGRIGQVDIYIYNDEYKEAGVKKRLLPDYTVIGAATQAAEGTQAHGAIHHPESGYQAVEMWPHSWIEQNPGRRFVMTQSAPLVYPRRANATFAATVR